MRIFYSVFACILATLIFYWLLVHPVYKKVADEKKKLVVINQDSRKKSANDNGKNNDYSSVKEMSKIANVLNVDAEVTVSKADALHPLIHVKAAGDYSQLIQFMIEIISKSQNLFLVSLSLFPLGAQEEGSLQMDARFGRYL